MYVGVAASANIACAPVVHLYVIRLLLLLLHIILQVCFFPSDKFHAILADRSRLCHANTRNNILIRRNNTHRCNVYNIQ